jgi:PleD family two-component response regulator
LPAQEQTCLFFDVWIIFLCFLAGFLLYNSSAHRTAREIKYGFAMKNGKILVAEDNQLNKDTLTEILTEEGYDVKAVNDGREGIEAFHQDKYDIIITDLRMPRVDGLNFRST